MRKHIILAAMATAALFTACSNETETEQALQGIPVNFTISGPSTRATTSIDNNVYKTTFDENDKFGVYSSNLLIDMDNAVCTYTSSGVTLEKIYFFKDQSTTVSFVAYYPYDGTTNAGTVVPGKDEISYTIAADQSSDKIKVNDFMIACASQDGATPTVNLNFDHQLALLEVNLEDITASNVYVNSIQPTVKWTPTNLETSGDKTVVTMSDQDSGKKFWALVPPQTIESGSILFTIVESSTSMKYGYTTTQALTINKNGVYKITLKKKETAEQASLVVSASNWATPESIDGDGTKEAAEQYVDPVTETTSLNTTITSLYQLTLSDKNPSGDSWGRNMVSKKSEPKAIDGGWEIELTHSSSSATWSNDCLVYYGGKTQMAVGIYKLTFKAKTTNASGHNLTTRLLYYGESANTFYGMEATSDATTWKGGITHNVTTTEQSFVAYINTGVTGSSTATATANTINTNSTQYFIHFQVTDPAEGTEETLTITDIKIERM